MTNEEKIVAALEELKKGQEAFVAEWRVTRDEAKTRMKELAAESERRRATYDREAKRAKLVSWILGVILIGWIVGPAIVSSVLTRFSR